MISLPGPEDSPSSNDDQRTVAEQLLSRLPVLPAVSSRLLGMMGRQDVSLKEISNLIISDAALTGEILRMCNSAMFGARSEVRSILQAIAILGTEKVKGLACTVALRSFLGNALQIPCLKRCWRHNLATAVVAAELAEWVRQDSGEAYTAAILHDIGRLGLIAVDPSQYVRLLDKASEKGGSLLAHETEVYSLDHATAGDWLASAWGLPPFICEAIRDHHAGLRAPYDSVNGLVHYACRVADVIGFGVLDAIENKDPVTEFLGQLPQAQRARLNVSIPELQILIASRVNALES